MTCIVAVKNKQSNTVILGIDSAAVWNHKRRPGTLKKPFKLNVDYRDERLTIGIVTCGDFRIQQILMYHLELPRYEHKDPYEYIVSCFIPAIRQAMKDHGYAKVHDNVETGGFFLLAILGRIFHVESNFQVVEYFDDFTAEGCGEDFALGAMFAVHTIETNERGTYDAYLLAQWGLEAAAKFSGWVCEPFEYMEV